MFFVAIEGIDASGKATQARLLKEWFTHRRDADTGEHLTVLSSSFPDYASQTGRAILAHLKRDWCVRYTNEPGQLTKDQRDTDPLVFQSLQTSNRLECLPVEAWTRPLNTVLISDRYHASALVYGALDGLSPELLDKMNRSLPMPDLYLLLDVSLEESLDRRPERRDRYEANHAYMRTVRTAYLELFASRSGWRTITGMQSVQEVHYDIVQHVQKAFPTLSI